MPAGEGMRRFYIAGDLSCHAETNAAPAHFWKANGAAAAIRFVAQVFFAISNFCKRPCVIAIPLDCVHGQVEVGVKDEPGLFHERIKAAVARRTQAGERRSK